MSAVVLSLALLLASVSAIDSLHVVSIQRRGKTFEEYTEHAHEKTRTSREVRLSGTSSTELIGVSSNFYANITIGTPPQPFSVLLNTAVTGLWVPSSMCPTSKYDMCKDHKLYYSNYSKTYVSENRTTSYAGMTAQLSIDSVGIANYTVQSQSFAEVIQYNFKDSSIPYDGIFGLDLSRQIFYNDTSIFTNMVSQQLINATLYGLYYFKNSPDPSTSGGLIIGGRNSSLFVGDLIYRNSTKDTSWEFIVDEVVLFGSSDMPPLCKGGCRTVPDTGSHFISANHRDMDTLHQHLGATVYSEDYTYQFNCSNLDKLPSVYFSIEESLFEVPWQSYVDKVMGPAKSVVCLSSFVGLDDIAGPNWYLGDVFFSSVYVEFDVDNQRLGFGQLVSTLGS